MIDKDTREGQKADYWLGAKEFEMDSIKEWSWIEIWRDDSVLSDSLDYVILNRKNVIRGSSRMNIEIVRYNSS